MLNQLTFTRFIAALAIVVFHYGQFVAPFNTVYLDSLFKNANIGVSFFFILSGFVMVIAYGQKEAKVNSKDYYVNRFARIYPVYIIALLLTCLVYYSRYHTIDLNAFVLHVTATQAWVPRYATTLNSPGWSLSVEILFYLLFPLLINFFYKKYSFKALALFTILIWAITQLLVNYLFRSSFYQGYPSDSHNLLFYFPLAHLNQFLIGNLTAYLFLKCQRKNYDMALLILSLLIPVTIIVVANNHININLHDGFMSIAFAPLILLLALNNGRITQVLVNKRLIVLGEISYSMYILQYPLHTIVLYVGKVANFKHPDILFYLFFIVLLISSHLSYFFIELPARTWIKNNLSNKKQLAAKTA